MKKIALINQRYGREVNGGSEYYTMLMAEKLKESYEVEVLTTKALTYDSWENYYKENIEYIDGIKVHRFGVKRHRNRYLQKIIGKLITLLHLNFRWLCKLWIKAQGPYVPDLTDYIKYHKVDYDIFVFITYLYYPVVFGLPEVKDKAVFIPTAHDEYCIYFKIFKELFHLPRAFIFLTEEEEQFVRQLFGLRDIKYEIAGTGVDLPSGINAERFREKYKINEDYLIYVGRVEKNKGCGEMFEFFSRCLCEHKNIKLVVVGKSYMKVPESDNIVYLGYVTETDKFDAIQGARALWLPSQYESLSIAVLEAMALGKPVIVNGNCHVLRGHCEKSNGGVYYTNYEGFKKALKQIYSEKYVEMCENARYYVERYYRWENVIAKWKSIFSYIMNNEDMTDENIERNS